MPFLYLLSCESAELELAQAELWALSGCEAHLAGGRLGVSAVACDISRAAYISLCGELLAQGSDLADLCERVHAREVQGARFRIEVRALAQKAQLPSPEIARRLADAMNGHPDLSHPRERYAVLYEPGYWRFVRVLSSSHHGYLAQASRPHNFSHALPARQARALVNLVAAPADSLLDPCCGVGTCVIEARAMGIRAVGCDISRAIAAAAAANARHLGHPACIFVADARQVSGRFDAAVLDLPYGHSSRVTPGLYREILNNVASRVSRLSVVTGRPVDCLLEDLGLRIVRRAQVRKNRLVRHYYVLWSDSGVWEKKNGGLARAL